MSKGKPGKLQYRVTIEPAAFPIDWFVEEPRPEVLPEVNVMKLFSPTLMVGSNRRHNTQHNDIQDDDIQHIGIEHNNK
jgi:hypothetical protein